MDVKILLEDAKRAGLRLSLVNGKLCLVGKPQRDMLNRLSAMKNELISYLSESTSWGVTGIPTFAEARAIQKGLAAQHGPRSTACGRAADGTYYVRPKWWKEFEQPVLTFYPAAEAIRAVWDIPQSLIKAPVLRER